LPEVEEGIEKGKYSTREELEKAVSSRINPKGDFLGSAEYRKYIAGVTAADCLEACCPDYFQSEGGQDEG
jgi:CO/xanthine dehydrogenase FAD-binding subunit